MKNIKIIMIGILAVLIGVFGYYGFYSWNSAQTVKKIEQAEDQLFVLGHPGCIYCNMFEPILKRVTEEYGVSYTYVNTDELRKKDFYKILELLHTTIEEFGTPCMLVMKEQKLVDSQQGYMDDLGFFEFLKKNHYIVEDEVFHDTYQHIQRLTGQTFVETTLKDTPQIVLIGRSGHERTEEILSELDQLEQMNISFLNPSNIGSFYPKFIASLDGYLDQDRLELPLLLVIQNNQVIEEIELDEIVSTIEKVKEYRDGE